MRLPALLLVLLCAATLQAQPVVDGFTLGGGVVVYQGDLDQNPEDGPIEFFSFSNPSLFVAADRTLGPVVTEASIQVDRVSITSDQIDMNLLSASLGLTVGVPIGLIRPGFFRLYAGVAPTLVSPSYDRLEGEYPGFEELGAHVVWTFPVGIVIQDSIRFGFRFIASDDFDSTVGSTSARDFLTFVSVGYRFDLLR